MEQSRIDQLDVLRGIAILGILLINLPPAATTLTAAFEFPYLAGWTAADRTAWAFLELYVEGTQRGLLEFLFGASMLILTAKAMEGEAPRRAVGLYVRRNLWLLVFGLVNVFLLLYPGDILFIYAVAAFFLLPFRRLSPRTLLALGLVWSLVTVGMGAERYSEQAGLMREAAAVEARLSAGGSPDASDEATLSAWQEAKAAARPDPDFIAWDEQGRRGSLRDYAHVMHSFWIERARSLELFLHAIPEAFATMLIGAALFKWGVLQGRRSRRFYLWAMIAAYAFGLGLRAAAIGEWLKFDALPRIDWISDEPARLAVSFGHVCLVSLLLASESGRRLLAPLKAAGRTAFSLYVMQTLLIMWLLFPEIGLGLWGALGWTEMLGLALVIAAVQLVIANVWLRRFAIGPVEWAWRSLAHWKRQPFLRPPERVAVLPA